MKKVLLFFSILFLSFSTNAQNLISIKSNGVSTFYTDLQVAFNVSQNGDVLYLSWGVS